MMQPDPAEELEQLQAQLWRLVHRALVALAGAVGIGLVMPWFWAGVLAAAVWCSALMFGPDLRDRWREARRPNGGRDHGR